MVQYEDRPAAAEDPTVEAVRRAVEAAPDGILVADGDGRIVFANPMACDMFGYTVDEFVGANVDVLLPDELRGGHATHRSSYVAHPRTRPMGSGLDLRGRKKSGEEFPVEISLSPVRTSGSVFVVAIVRDVTDRRRSAEELMAAHEELALVGDRERIARDLHDTVIQRLFAVGLSLQSALMRTEDPALSGRIQEAVDEIDGTIRDIRTAIFSLHARRGVASGPRDAVLTTVREAARALGFEPRVHFDGVIDNAMTSNVQEHLIPTLREALSNIAKHADATRVSVSIVTDDSTIVMRVTDNGVGITDSGSLAGGRGLGNMSERAEALHGSCRVFENEGGGTVVEWTVPLR